MQGISVGAGGLLSEVFNGEPQASAPDFASACGSPLNEIAPLGRSPASHGFSLQQCEHFEVGREGEHVEGIQLHDLILGC